jgi:hypothetical protein
MTQTSAALPAQVQHDLESLASSYYNGALERAFRHWAMHCCLDDQILSEDDVIELNLDGSGDLGIDGYWVDEANSSLLLFQSKFSSVGSGRLDRRVVQEFIEASAALTRPDFVREHGNALIQDAYPDLLQLLLDDAYSLRLIIITNLRVQPAARNYAVSTSNDVWHFEFDGEPHSKERTIEILDVRAILEERNRLRANRNLVPEVTFSVSPERLHSVPGQFLMTDTTVSAQELIEVYANKRHAIFQLNLRGPLGANRVNTEIAETLHDPEMRKYFHVLNNGLTAVCDNVEYDPSTEELTITDFQIVNGGQTTYTLFREREHVTPDVLLNIRIIRGQQFSKLISKSTNSQSVVKPEDFRSLDLEHAEIAERLSKLQPPWLYEAKRGQKNFDPESTQERNRARYGKRRVSMRNLGQNALAFIGHPGEAKWDLRKLFDEQDPEGQEWYRAIYMSDLIGEQLILPTEVADRVKATVANRIKVAGQDEPTNTWLSYARTHLVALIAEWSRIKEGAPANFLSPTAAKARLATIDDWFAEAFGESLDAVRYRVEMAEEQAAEAGEARKLPNLREFFRKPENFRRMMDRLRTQLREKRQ